MRNFKTSKQGFTLIEVLIVVVIISVLASLVIPRMMGSPEKAMIAEAYQMIGALNRAQQKRMDTSGTATAVEFFCPEAPSTCTLSSSLGMKDIQQKNFRYGCSDTGGNFFCLAWRTGIPGVPFIARYYTGPDVGSWSCLNGYVGTDTGVEGWSDKGCKPAW